MQNEQRQKSYFAFKPKENTWKIILKNIFGFHLGFILLY